jgi:hypothetical protein
MPNISETSVSDMSLSRAWSVMIIFLLVDSWFRDRLFGPRVSAAYWVKAPERSCKRLGRTARTVTDLRLSKDLRRETTVGGRDQQELNLHDQLGSIQRPVDAVEQTLVGLTLSDRRWPLIAAKYGPTVARRAPDVRFLINRLPTLQTEPLTPCLQSGGMGLAERH